MEIPSGYLIETSFERMYRTFTRPAEPHEARYSIPRQDVKAPLGIGPCFGSIVVVRSFVVE
jgi:hypothetical protein